MLGILSRIQQIHYPSYGLSLCLNSGKNDQAKDQSYFIITRIFEEDSLLVNKTDGRKQMAPSTKELRQHWSPTPSQTSSNIT